MSSLTEKVDIYRKMAQQYGNGNGGDGGLDPHNSKNPYTQMATNWEPEGERVLPDINAQMKKIASRFNMETPDAPPQLTGKTEANITVGKALWSLAAANLLSAERIVNPLNGKTIAEFKSAADTGEDWVLDKMNKGFEKFNIDARRARPTPEILALRALEIEKKFAQLMGGRVSELPTPAQLAANIHSETQKQVRGLYVKQVDKSEKPNKSEEILAAQLEGMVGHNSPKEIAERLRDIVFAQAADIALANQQATLSRIAPEFNDRYDKLKREKPEEFYIAPWLVTEVMFPKGQQKEIEDTTWALSPTRLHVMRILIESDREDKRIIDLAQVNNTDSPQGVLSSHGTPPYIDYLKKRTSHITLPIIGWDIGRAVQPYIDMLASPRMGGILVLRQIQAKDDPVIIAVPDAPLANRTIGRLAQLNKDAAAVSEIINSTITEVEASLKEPIRPAMVRRMLPPLALDKQLYKGSKGNILYSRATQNLQAELRGLQAKHRALEVAKAQTIFTISQADPSLDYAKAKQIAEEQLSRATTAVQKRISLLETQIDEISKQL